jgi:hypothetical protein
MRHDDAVRFRRGLRKLTLVLSSFSFILQLFDLYGRIPVFGSEDGETLTT